MDATVSEPCVCEISKQSMRSNGSGRFSALCSSSAASSSVFKLILPLRRRSSRSLPAFSSASCKRSRLVPRCGRINSTLCPAFFRQPGSKHRSFIFFRQIRQNYLARYKRSIIVILLDKRRYHFLPAVAAVGQKEILAPNQACRCAQKRFAGKCLYRLWHNRLHPYHRRR